MSSALAAYEAIAKETTFDPVNDCRPAAPAAVARCRARPAADRGRAAAAGILAGFDLSQTAKLARRRRCGLSPCPGLRAAAAPDLAAGSADARLLHPARLPLRGDARLPDARRPGPARSGPGQGMDDVRLAGRSMPAPPTWRWWPACRRISMRCWRSPCRRCRSTMRWSRRRARTFSRVSLASRVYSRIKPSAAAQSLPPWRPSDALGRGGRAASSPGPRARS